MKPLLSYQPFKALITLFALIIAPPTVLFWCLYYLPRPLRPHRNWSLRTSVANTALKGFYMYVVAVRLKPWLIRAPGPAKSHVTEVAPSTKGLYRGVLNQKSIRPARMGAIWFPRPFDAAADTAMTVILHFQGGAFVTYDDPHQLGVFPSQMYDKYLGALTFYAQYRQSLDDSSRFPAALQDVVTFYQYLLDQGVAATNIIVAGDSSGGNLVLAFLRYLEAQDELLPRPRAAVIWSPWVNLDSEAIRTCHRSPRAKTDFLRRSLLQWGADAYKPSAGVAASVPDTTAYVSPLHHPFKSTTPLWINAGTAELFYEDIGTFADEMQGVSGNRIRYLRTPDSTHDLVLSAKTFGFTKEAAEAMQDISEYLNSL